MIEDMIVIGGLECNSTSLFYIKKIPLNCEMNKNNSIIKAFENLDEYVRGITSNDGQAYQDVPKDIFMKS